MTDRTDRPGDPGEAGFPGEVTPPSEPWPTSANDDSTDDESADDESADAEVDQAAKRDAVRVRASELLANQKRRERRRVWLIWIGVVVVVLVATASVCVALLTTPQKSNSAPAGASGNGVPVSAAQVLAANPAASPTPVPHATPTALAADGASATPTAAVLPIRLYVDYASSSAAVFERANRDQLGSWVVTGAATLEVFPLVVPGGANDPSQYSLRAANAAACVAEFAPDRFYDFSNRLMLAAPKQGAAMPSDQQVLQLASAAGVGHASDLSGCVSALRFEHWLESASTSALTGPLPNADIQSILPDETPAVIVGGKHYPWSDPSNSSALALFFATAAGGEFNQESTATPTPSPTPSATPTP